MHVAGSAFHVQGYLAPPSDAGDTRDDAPYPPRPAQPNAAATNPAQDRAETSAAAAPPPVAGPTPALALALAQSSLVQRRELLHALGARTATQLGWNAQAYNAEELTALGEQSVIDCALNGNDKAAVRTLAALAQAAGMCECDASGPGNAGEMAQQVCTFLAARFQPELSLWDATRRLASLRLPGRPHDAGFQHEFASYTQTAARENARLVDGWISWIASRHGVDLGAARIDVAGCALQYYRRQTQVLRDGAIPYDGPTLSAVPAAGYVAAIHSDSCRYRYFLSTAGEGAYRIPDEALPADWALQHADIVFGISNGGELQDGAAANGLHARVALERLAEGERGELSAGLTAAIQARLNEGRDPACGNVPAVQAADGAIHFISMRRMMTALRADHTPMLQAPDPLDVLTAAIPILCSGPRLIATRERTLASGAATAAGAPADTMAELHRGLQAALESLHAPEGTARALWPVDACAMGTALASRHPALAHALCNATVRTTRAWSSQPASPARTTTRRRPPATYPAGEEQDAPAVKRGGAQAGTSAGNHAAALPPIGPTALQLSAFQERLVNRIEGGASATQIADMRHLLARLAVHVHGRTILGAMQAHYALSGVEPRIALLDGHSPAALRPSLRRPAPGNLWQLDLPALKAASVESIARELAAVYNNMTGILQGEHPYADLQRAGGPPLPRELELAWTTWASADRDSDRRNDPPSAVPSTRQAAIDRLRCQLCHARCYGGVDERVLRVALQGKTEGYARIAGLRIDLANCALTEIPPLPSDVRALDLSRNRIADWSGLPSGLKALIACETGGSSVFDCLPASLASLDVSGNALETLPTHLLPRGLERLRANDNLLTQVPALPQGLRRLLLSGNKIAALPDNLPRRLRLLDMSRNQLTTLPASMPPGLGDLDLSENWLLDISGGELPPDLRVLDIGRNPHLQSLPVLPATLATLYVECTGITRLPDDLPRGLRQLHAAGLGLAELPDTLPHGLTVLGLTENGLTRLPPSISDLTSCEVFLAGNPLRRADLPARHPGEPGPVFHLPAAPWEQSTEYSATLAQAVRRWLNETDTEAADRWVAIDRVPDGESNEAGAWMGESSGRRTVAQFRRFVDELRTTASHQHPDFRASVRQWLVELSRPERRPLLERTLQACESATERCDDRVALVLNDLTKMWLHDDIRIGRYDDRPAQAVDVIRQTFRLDTLRDIAYRKIRSLDGADDVEVYLAYAVMLREPLALSSVVPEMRFFEASHVTENDLDQALREVREAERTHFYRELVLDDTWNAYLAPKVGARYATASRLLQEQADEPLQARMRAQLRQQGLDPDDLDAQRNIGRTVWRQMRYEVLEPLTRAYLASHGVPLAFDAAP